MHNHVKKFFSQYLYYRKSDRNAVILISVLILISITANLIISNIEPKSKYDYAEFKKLAEGWELNDETTNPNNQHLFSFNPNSISKEELDSLNIPSFVKQNILNYRNAGGSFTNSEQLRKIYGMNDSIFAEIEPYISIPEIEINQKKVAVSEKIEIKNSGFFDPNIANKKMLSQFGFNSFQTENLMKYRENGGILSQKSDLLRIYGVDSLFYSSIEKNIQIKNKAENKSIDIPLIMVEINSADSMELMKLEGIGPTFANRILKYRDLLGGFYSKTQLLEVYNFPNETYLKIEKQINVDTLKLKKIRINYVDFPELIRHPYLDKNDVNSILQFREKNGAYRNLAQIKTVQNMDSIQFLRIRPYITCR